MNNNDIYEYCEDSIETYLEENGSFFSNPNYFDLLVDTLVENIIEINKQAEIYTEDKDSLIELVEKYTLEILELMCIPLRENCLYETIPFSLNDTKNEIDRINMYPIQKQRSSEWYEARHNLFSASNMWKLFSTDSQYNSLIYEKCNADNIKKNDTNDISLPNPRNWGIKYEPISVMIYEDKNKTKVNTKYGCIPHEFLPIGASPDGIVCDENSNKFGRLIEIKNIFNREITGIPSQEYWIQIQIQMEVCRLQCCDFIETRIKEYENEDLYINDKNKDYKGMILFFIPIINNEHNHSFFDYMPLNCLDYKAYLNKAKDKYADTHILYNTYYWFLDEYICSEIQRNEVWFESVKPVIVEAWDTVLYERTHGYQHRAPKKRTNTLDKTDLSNNSENVKIIKLDFNI